MIPLQQSRFRYSSLLFAIFCISFMASGCTQTAVNGADRSANSSTKPVSTQTQEKIT